ncbi:MAG: hypothetical protein K2J33_01765 [Alistipes sp.]|nr:hypothetical protein [Alistipes sp.]
MKKLTLLFFAAASFAGCRTMCFDGAPTVGNTAPACPMHVAAGVQHCYLTDYFPQWDGADSLTVSGDCGVVLTPTAADWSEFDLASDGRTMAATIDAWRGGSRLSIVMLSGERDAQAQMFTTGAMLHIVSLSASVAPRDVVVMWQNCRLPDDCIVEVADGIGIVVPKDARTMERSFIRVYASSDEGLFNDVLVPLDRGRVVKSVERLDRHDTQAQVLYSLMIDRFRNGNPSNDRPLNREDVLPKVDYYGGDLRGVTDKIEDGFFEELGITTIWISPITQNPYDAWGLNEEPFTRFSGYHGYWPIYTTRIDERFGSDAELRELLATAHEHGLNVILDYVANHMHIDSPVLREHPDWTTPMYLPDGRRNLELWDDERLTTWFDVHIPTLDLEREEICEPMTDSALYWIANYDFDGFRHDACKHIPENYWRMLCRKMKTRFPERRLWQIGETYGSPELIGSYVKTGMIDAQFDFNVYHTALDVLAADGDMRRIAAEVERSAEAYGSHHTMGNITGNHDKPRFISVAGGAVSPDEDSKLAGWTRDIGVGDPIGYRKLALLEALICTVPGVPCIYQGDEYGAPGANDPDNRRMMAFDGYTETEQAQRETTRRLISLRRGSLPLLYGDMATLRLDERTWVFARAYMGEYVVAALNLDPEARTLEVSLPACFAREQELRPNFGGSAVRTSEGGVRLTVPGCGFELFTK